MDEMIDATFYRDDDFLTRTLTSSVLYDKNNLNLSLLENNNNTENKNNEPYNDFYKESNKNNQTQNHIESPNLDFLKLGSPDLEQILLNINNGDNSTAFNNDSNDVPYDFNLDDDLSSTDTYLTDALQELHDKDNALPDLSLLDVPNNLPVSNGHVIDEKMILKPSEMRDQHHVSKKTKVSRNMKSGKSVMKKYATNNNIHQYQNPRSNPKINRPMSALPNHVNMSMNEPISVNDHVLYNNNINMMNRINPGLSQLQQKQQQEIAFLSHAMGYQQDRENLHLLNQNNFQQKLLEQQLLHQQQQHQQHPMNGNPFQHVHPHMNHVAKMPYFHSLGMDDQTLKMFIDNPQLAPINLEIQEMVKRERKKLRNRIASSKCRKRKLEREGKLEDKVKDLKEKNIELNAIANALKQQICDLKQRVMDHVGEGCQIVLPS